MYVQVSTSGTLHSKHQTYSNSFSYCCGLSFFNTLISTSFLKQSYNILQSRSRCGKEASEQPISLLSYIPLKVTETGENWQDLRTWTSSWKVPMTEATSIKCAIPRIVKRSSVLLGGDARGVCDMWYPSYLSHDRHRLAEKNTTTKVARKGRRAAMEHTVHPWHKHMFFALTIHKTLKAWGALKMERIKASWVYRLWKFWSSSVPVCTGDATS